MRHRSLSPKSSSSAMLALASRHWLLERRCCPESNPFGDFGPIETRATSPFVISSDANPGSTSKRARGADAFTKWISKV